MIFPSQLKQADKIAIVAPAGKLTPGALDVAINSLSSWGLLVVLGDHVYDEHGYFAGTDTNRLADLQWALNDESIKAVLFARGGYGTTRILDQLDFAKFKTNPKWLIGYSDITALLLKGQTMGIAGIHGPMGTSFLHEGASASLEALKSLLFNGESRLSSSSTGGKQSVVEAEITGGNLALIVDSIGTGNEIDTRNKILFIEEVGEKTYRIDRMLRQLLRAGKFEQTAGLVFGYFNKIDDDIPFGQSWQEAILEITESFNFPVIFDFEIGHEPENMPVVMGGVYRLAVQENESTLTWMNSG